MHALGSETPPFKTYRSYLLKVIWWWDWELGASAVGEGCTPRVVRDRRLDNEQKLDTSTSDMHSATSEY